MYQRRASICFVNEIIEFLTLARTSGQIPAPDKAKLKVDNNRIADRIIKASINGNVAVLAEKSDKVLHYLIIQC